SGIGKALLAWSAPRALGPLAGFTPATITDAGALSADLALTRARGYALDDEERTPGMRCVAAAVFNAHGEPVAGVSVSGPAFRMPDSGLSAIGAQVAAAAAEVTEALGGQPPKADNKNQD
ncbi:MAG: IclR family transcriptional regulator C-terminal domain-containing protein, partial [Rhodobacteraceae bacterium]|nr:IclR family transcriptional regulator C-terminal domain-containing protein [Paracoccaceae bacterium]